MSESLQTQTMEDRLDRLRELTEFTESCKNRLNDIFESLGWSRDYQDNQEELEQCPYDPNHRVPARSMEKHKASCSLRTLGYSAEEQAEMYDPSVCYENSSVRSFRMDKSTQHKIIMQARSAAPLMRMEGVFWQATGVSIRVELGSRKFCCSGSGLPDNVHLSGPPSGQYSSQPVDVPQNHKRALCDLTVADRLALYDNVVGVLSQQKQTASSSNDDLYIDLVSKLQKNEEPNEPKTHLELIAEMRDYKRRRQSYRAKNVHITKKSYTEVIREVINVHSEELARQWREEEEEDKEEPRRSEHSSHRRRLDERRSVSSESHHSHSRRRRSRERSQDQESKKKKRKRERDSHSPDDRHHDRKKKNKKKKKEEREKEK